MADKIIEYTRHIPGTGGHIGTWTMHVEDGLITGVRLSMEGGWMQQADIQNLQSTFNELKTWGTANGYTWGTV